MEGWSSHACLCLHIVFEPNFAGLGRPSKTSRGADLASKHPSALVREKVKAKACIPVSPGTLMFLECPRLILHQHTQLL